jgi:hypothetical protein
MPQEVVAEFVRQGKSLSTLVGFGLREETYLKGIKSNAPKRLDA